MIASSEKQNEYSTDWKIKPNQGANWGIKQWKQNKYGEKMKEEEESAWKWQGEDGH